MSAWQDFKRGFLDVFKVRVGPTHYEDLGEAVGVWVLVGGSVFLLSLACLGFVAALVWLVS